MSEPLANRMAMRILHTNASTGNLMTQVGADTLRSLIDKENSAFDGLKNDHVVRRHSKNDGTRSVDVDQEQRKDEVKVGDVKKPTKSNRWDRLSHKPKS